MNALLAALSRQISTLESINVSSLSDDASFFAYHEAVCHMRAIHASLSTGERYFLSPPDEDGMAWTVVDEQKYQESFMDDLED